jgi:hypothetical protein
MCHSRGMDNAEGFDPETNEYSVIGAMRALDVSRATLDRWIPPGTAGRRLTQAYPGRPREVRYAAALIHQFAPAPGGDR